MHVELCRPWFPLELIVLLPNQNISWDPKLKHNILRNVVIIIYINNIINQNVFFWIQAVVSCWGPCVQTCRYKVKCCLQILAQSEPLNMFALEDILQFTIVCFDTCFQIYIHFLWQSVKLSPFITGHLH